MKRRLHRSLIFVLMAASAVPFFSTAAAVDLVSLKAGFAKIGITPDEPVQLAGYRSRTALSSGVHDELLARAIVIEQGTSRLVLVSIENLGFYSGTYEFLLEGIEAELGLEPRELVLSATHTHSAPSLTTDSEKGHPNNIAYTETLRSKIIEVIKEAQSNVQEVRLGIGSGDASIGVNRREQKPDGAIELGRNPSGVRDTEVLALSFQSESGEPLASLFNYAVHGTSLGAANLVVSGDLIGIASDLLEAWEFSGGFSAALIGPSGDIDPWYRVLPGFNESDGWVPETVLLGRMLAVEVAHVIKGIEEFRSSASVDSVFSTIKLPGKKRGERFPSESVSIPKVPLNLIAARIGDIGLVGLSGEVLTEVGWAIKQGSPFRHTLLVTHCNGAHGYLPPAHLYKEGGYEIETSPFSPAAADLAVKESLRLLYQLYSRSD